LFGFFKVKNKFMNLKYHFGRKKSTRQILKKLPGKNSITRVPAYFSLPGYPGIPG